MKYSVVTLLLCMSTIGVTAVDSDHDHDHGHDKKRSHDAHVHGSGTLSLVALDDQLMIEMEIPGFDIVGFEHQPSTDDQKEQIKAAIEFLSKSDLNIKLPEEALCKADDMGSVETDLDTNHHTDHDEHHDEHHGSHAEFHIVYNYRCEAMNELAYVEILSFEQFSNMEKLNAQAATEMGQFSATIAPGSKRFNLQ